jgi:hypothetical protein
MVNKKTCMPVNYTEWLNGARLDYLNREGYPQKADRHYLSLMPGWMIQAKTIAWSFIPDS